MLYEVITVRLAAPEGRAEGRALKDSLVTRGGQAQHYLAEGYNSIHKSYTPLYGPVYLIGLAQSSFFETLFHFRNYCSMISI